MKWCRMAQLRPVEWTDHVDRRTRRGPEEPRQGPQFQEAQSFFLPLLIINESSSCSDSSLSPGGHRVQVFKVQVSSSSGCSGCL